MSTKLNTQQKKFFGVVPGIVRDCLGELSSQAEAVAQMKQRAAEAARRQPSSDLSLEEQAEGWAQLVAIDCTAVAYAERTGADADKRKEILLADLAAGEAFVERLTAAMGKKGAAMTDGDLVKISRLSNALGRARRDYDHGRI